MQRSGGSVDRRDPIPGRVDAVVHTVRPPVGESVLQSKEMNSMEIIFALFVTLGVFFFTVFVLLRSL